MPSYFKKMSSFGGLSDKYEYHEFEFDSEDCTRSFQTTVSSKNHPNFYLGKPLDNVAAVKVLECQIPVRWYTINVPNNTFTLSETYSGTTNGVLNQTVTIQPGLYTGPMLMAALVLQLNEISYRNANKGPPARDFSYSTSFYNSGSGKFHFRSTRDLAATASKFTFTFPVDLILANQLGFTTSANDSTIETSGYISCKLIPPNQAKLGGADYVYLCSRTLGSLIKLYLPGGGVVNPINSGADGPQIAKIPINVNAGDVNYWVDPDPEKWFDVGNSVFTGNLDFYFTLGTADFRIPLDLQGFGFNLKLGVLTNKTQHDDYLGGGKQNKRALARTWPTGGSSYQPF